MSTWRAIDTFHFDFLPLPRQFSALRLVILFEQSKESPPHSHLYVAEPVQTRSCGPKRSADDPVSLRRPAAGSLGATCLDRKQATRLSP